MGLLCHFEEAVLTNGALIAEKDAKMRYHPLPKRAGIFHISHFLRRYLSDYISSPHSTANGQTFRFSERKPGENFPPFRTRCRCGFTVVIENGEEYTGFATDEKRGKMGRGNGGLDSGTEPKEARFIAHMNRDDKDSVREKLDDFVRRYSDATNENILVITKSGDVYEISGGAKRITFAKSDEALFDGAITIHNHPTGISEYSFSATYAYDDIPSFLRERGEIMEAFDELYHYRFLRPESVTLEEWNKAYYEAGELVLERLDESGFSIDNASVQYEIQHTRIEITCSILGIENHYTRWER